MSPCFSVLDVFDRRTSYAIGLSYLSFRLLPRSEPRPYLPDLFDSQFCRWQSLTLLSRAVFRCVSNVLLWGSPPKISKQIIGFTSIVVSGVMLWGGARTMEGFADKRRDKKTFIFPVHSECNKEVATGISRQRVFQSHWKLNAYRPGEGVGCVRSDAAPDSSGITHLVRGRLLHNAPFFGNRFVSHLARFLRAVGQRRRSRYERIVRLVIMLQYSFNGNKPMKKGFLGILIAALLAVVPAHAQRMMVLGTGGFLPPSYTGPGNIQSGATFFIGVRAYDAAHATGSTTAFNIRRASDNATQDLNILSTGAFDTAGYNTFVGTDATASCTIAGTAMACTGASATIHVGDPATGAGITNPCVVTVTNGSTTATVSLAGTTTSCGTVAVAVPVTFQVAGFIPRAYDQSGNTNDLPQATAGSQLQFLPNCGDGFPCIFSTNGGGRFFTPATVASANLTYQEGVVNRVVVSSFPVLVGQYDVGLNPNGGTLGWNSNIANSVRLASVAGSIVATANDNAFHSLQGVIAGAVTSNLSVDCTQTPGDAGVGSAYTKFDVGSYMNAGAGGVAPVTGYIHEAGAWVATPSGATITSQSHNIRLYYGTPGAC